MPRNTATLPINLQIDVPKVDYNADLVSHLIIEGLKNVLYMRNHIQIPTRDLLKKDASTAKPRERVKHDSYISNFTSMCKEIENISRNHRVSGAYFITGSNVMFPVEVLHLAFNFSDKRAEITATERELSNASKSLVRAQIEALSSFPAPKAGRYKFFVILEVNNTVYESIETEEYSEFTFKEIIHMTPKRGAKPVVNININQLLKETPPGVNAECEKDGDSNSSSRNNSIYWVLKRGLRY